MEDFIFKILRPSELESAKTSTAYHGSADDIRDGFIHFSTALQLNGTANKYFSSEASIYLLKFSSSAFDEASLKWEKSRDSVLFPHLYASLDIHLATSCIHIKKSPDTPFDFSKIVSD